jgi:hypothetical protein
MYGKGDARRPRRHLALGSRGSSAVFRIGIRADLAIEGKGYVFVRKRTGLITNGGLGKNRQESAGQD